ncbi:hypothetical protein QE152_g11319 [Popillia japonica]|uniref:Uncharacterized protein n=1 Tax=Popillia japonica TaxID=7064 RepID=A0AAW1LLK9_POPJA
MEARQSRCRSNLKPFSSPFLNLKPFSSPFFPPFLSFRSVWLIPPRSASCPSPASERPVPRGPTRAIVIFKRRTNQATGREKLAAIGCSVEGRRVSRGGRSSPPLDVRLKDDGFQLFRAWCAVAIRIRYGDEARRHWMFG